MGPMSDAEFGLFLAIGLAPIALVCYAARKPVTLLADIKKSPFGHLYALAVCGSWSAWMLGALFGWQHWGWALVTFFALGFMGFFLRFR